MVAELLGQAYLYHRLGDAQNAGGAAVSGIERILRLGCTILALRRAQPGTFTAPAEHPAEQQELRQHHQRQCRHDFHRRHATQQHHQRLHMRRKHHLGGVERIAEQHLVHQDLAQPDNIEPRDQRQRRQQELGSEQTRCPGDHAQRTTQQLHGFQVGDPRCRIDPVVELCQLIPRRLAVALERGISHRWSPRRVPPRQTAGTPPAPAASVHRGYPSPR